VRGTCIGPGQNCKWIEEGDRRTREEADCFLGTNRSDMYLGARPCLTLKANMSTLN